MSQSGISDFVVDPILQSQAQYSDAKPAGFLSRDVDPLVQQAQWSLKNKGKLRDSCSRRSTSAKIGFLE